MNTATIRATFQARNTGRVFFSAADRDAFDRGYSDFPAVPLEPQYSPVWTGYYEAERAEQDRNDCRTWGDDE